MQGKAIFIRKNNEIVYSLKCPEVKEQSDRIILISFPHFDAPDVQHNSHFPY